VRDIAKNDLVAWIDERLSVSSSISPGPSSEVNFQERLIGPLRNIYGVSDKILTMTLSGLLLGASGGRPPWFDNDFPADGRCRSSQFCADQWSHRKADVRRRE
jgi:hypothetical protein